MSIDAELAKIIERAIRPLVEQVEALRMEVASLRGAARVTDTTADEAMDATVNEALRAVGIGEPDLAEAEGVALGDWMRASASELPRATAALKELRARHQGAHQGRRKLTVPESD